MLVFLSVINWLVSKQHTVRLGEGYLISFLFIV